MGANKVKAKKMGYILVRLAKDGEEIIILTAEEDPNRRQSVGDEFRFLFCQQIVSVHTVR